ncbi:MAG: serine hydrolase domain-containing protein [Saprospiraceae bacterium]|nr:serine hydrolase domain-containing protein [Saprospiraceae bacterium]
MKNTLILFALPLSLFSQPLQHELDSLMYQAFKADQPGGALLIMQQNKIIYNNAIGLADLNKKKKLTSRSNFRMASVSKQFTAAAIVLLEKQGKLTLNDHIIKFFPDFTSVGKTITIQHLLTHSSGIWDYESMIPDTLQTQLSDVDVMNLIKNINKTYFTPGTAYRYSNSGYCLLALIVEKASGQSFANFLKHEIFQLLKMKQTIVYEFTTNIKNRAYGFAYNDQKQLIPSDQSLTSATKGDGGIYTSLNDYKKWHDALLNNTLFDLNYALEQTRTPLPDGAGYYSMGWFYQEHPEVGKILFHSGSTCGFSNLVIRIPKEGILIACFSNIAGNHQAFQPVFEYLQQKGMLPVEVWQWHEMTD